MLAVPCSRAVPAGPKHMAAEYPTVNVTAPLHASAQRTANAALVLPASSTSIAIVAFTFVALAIASLISAALNPDPFDGRRNFTLSALLLLIGAIWLLAARTWPNATKPHIFVTMAPASTLIICGGLLMTLLVAIRLMGAGDFGGHAAHFDFGAKCPHRSNITCTARNVAFTPEFNSVGHCLQGVLAVLLFHSVEQACGEARLVPVRLASSLVTGYPVYNAIKRSFYAGSWFAASSFAQNSAEWVIGFQIGVSSGVLHSAITSSLPDPSLGTHMSSCAQRGVAAWCRACGVVLCAVCVLVAILFGVTWDNTSHRTSNDPEDVAVLIGLLALTVVTLGVAMRTVSNRAQTADLVELAHKSARHSGKRSAGSVSEEL